LRVDSKGKRLNEVEARNDGRLVLFCDIVQLECVIGPSTLQKGASGAKISFFTTEDELHVESVLPRSVVETWVIAVRDCVMFCSIPIPESHPDKSRRSSGSGFRTVSSAAFHSTGDMELMFESVASHPTLCKSAAYPAITEMCRYLNDILSAVRGVRCNKDAFGTFAERLEDLVRTMLDPLGPGLLLGIRDSDCGLVTFQLNAMCSKGLKHAEDLVKSLSTDCWLQAGVSLSGMPGGLRGLLEQLDGDILVKCANRIIRSLGSAQAAAFPEIKYDMVVDVKSSLASMGGAEVVYSNPAKVQALARIIQADPADIVREIEILFDSADDQLPSDGAAGDGKGFQSDAPVSAQRALSSTGGAVPLSAFGISSPEPEQGQRSGLVQKLFCCFNSKKSVKKPIRRKSNKSLGGSTLSDKLLPEAS
jgi:hypothetical protein